VFCVITKCFKHKLVLKYFYWHSRKVVMPPDACGFKGLTLEKPWTQTRSWNQVIYDSCYNIDLQAHGWNVIFVLKYSSNLSWKLYTHLTKSIKITTWNNLHKTRDKLDYKSWFSVINKWMFTFVKASNDGGMGKRVIYVGVRCCENRSVWLVKDLQRHSANLVFFLCVMC